MKCPVDNATLLITDRSGIEIDYCPECRGVWLDRGELDKLVQGSSRHEESRHDDRDRGYSEDRRSDHGDRREYRDDDHHRGHDSHQGKHKKESFLGDIFDF